MEVDLGTVHATAAVAIAAAKWNSGVDAETGLARRVDIKKNGNAGIKTALVKNSRMTEDVHQQSVGAVGRVKLHPLPIGTRTNAARCGMNLGKSTRPGWIGADVGV